MGFKENKIIQEVFANKLQNVIKKGKNSFATGGAVDSSDVYSPIEFLNTFMNVISVEEGIKKDREIKALEEELNKKIEVKLGQYNTTSFYRLPMDEIEQINELRKELDSKRMFVTDAEIEAYLYTNPELPKENYISKSKFSQQELIDMGLIMVDIVNGSVNYVYKWEYLSGNIQEKMSNCKIYAEKYTEYISEELYNKQLDLLAYVMNDFAIITQDSSKNKIFISPSSEFASNIEIFEIEPEDYLFSMETSRNLKDCFILWLRNEADDSLFKLTKIGGNSIISYYVNKNKPDSGDERTNINLRQNAQIEGQQLFDVFLNTALTNECKKRLEYVWNAKFNNYVEPRKYKIPIALTCGKKWKKDSDFMPNEPQIQSVQFMNVVKSGLLAYGVGVGKTASAILNMSYAFDNGFSKKALLVVPLATKEKWKAEIQGVETTAYVVSYKENGEKLTKSFADRKEAKKFLLERKESDTTLEPKMVRTQFEEEEFEYADGGGVDSLIEEQKYFSKGILPHLPKIVDLGNLSKDKIFDIKDYTVEEEKQIAVHEELLIFLSGLPKNYDFENNSINSKIKNIYNDFSAVNVINFYENSGTEKENILTWYVKQVKNTLNSMYYSFGKIKKFDDKTIFVITYEGLAKLSLDSEGSRSIVSKLYEELSQGEELDQIGDTSMSETIQSIVSGVGKNQTIFLDELGIDYAVFDESHNFKKVYTSVKAKPYNKNKDFDYKGKLIRDKSKYSITSGKNINPRSLYAWCISRYIQIKNDNRGVLHLTATPFTNHPIEVYSMLSLVNYEALVKAGFKYMEDFFDTFMRISFEIRFTASQTIKKEEVLSGYNNTPEMRTLIYSIMDYKNGEDANIKRPKKIVYPSISKGIETTLNPTPVQKEYISLIKQYIKGDKLLNEICGEISNEFNVDELSDETLLEIINSEGSEAQKDKYETIELPLEYEVRKKIEQEVNAIKNKSNKESLDESDSYLSESDSLAIRTLKGLSMIKQVTLSPYLFSCVKANTEPNYKEYIESSPKLLYIVNSIKTIRYFEEENGLQKSGSVIYMNISVDPKVVVEKDGVKITKSWQEGGFEKIKKYFVNELGYTENEISIVKGSGMNNDEKEREKNKFLAGESLVLIGSSTISTGVDLQNNASSMFIASFDWNPTDNEQINGRIHRQGNRFANVRIVYPMVQNSADPVIFQLLQEKTTRIKEIWDREGKTGELDIKDFDPKKFKEKLITDPQARVEVYVETKIDEINNRIVTLNNNKKVLDEASSEMQKMNKYKEPMKALLTVVTAFKDGKAKDFSNISNDDMFKSLSTLLTNADSWYKKEQEKLGEKEFLTKINHFVSENYPNYFKGIYITEKEQKELESKIKEVEDKQFVISGKIDELKESSLSEKDKLEKLKSLNEKYYELQSEYRKLNNILESKNSNVKIYFEEYFGVLRDVETWKQAKTLFNKEMRKLDTIGLDVENIESERDKFSSELESLNLEKKNVIEEANVVMLPIYQKEYEENLKATPSILERVDEFSDANSEYLTKFLNPFKIDEAKIEKPKEVEPIESEKAKAYQPVVSEPSKEIVDFYNKNGKKEAYLYNNRIGYNKGLQSKEQYDLNHEWISNQKDDVESSSNEEIDYLESKLKATELLLKFKRNSGSQEEIEYLESKIKATKILIKFKTK